MFTASFKPNEALIKAVLVSDTKWEVKVFSKIRSRLRVADLKVGGSGPSTARLSLLNP